MTHELLQFFVYNHLPEHLQKVSKPFSDAAHKLSAMNEAQLRKEAAAIVNRDPSNVLSELLKMVTEATPDNIESVVAKRKMDTAEFLLSVPAVDSPLIEAVDEILRYLLEAKDCAVRSLLYKKPE